MTELTEERQTGWVADDSTFGARLALVRQRMGWGNLKEAAIACGLPVESWRRWERDNRAPRDVRDVAWQIAERTGCDYAWLLDGPRLRHPVPAISTEPRVLARERKGVAPQPNVFYTGQADRTTRHLPTPASQGSPGRRPTANHSAATPSPVRPPGTTPVHPQRRTARRNRPTP